MASNSPVGIKEENFDLTPPRTITESDIETPPKDKECWDDSDAHTFVKEENWESSDWNHEAPASSTGRKRKAAVNMPTIAESIGMDLHAPHPKNAVREFLVRYFGEKTKREDLYYVVKEEESGFRAKLHVPIWSSGVFEGQCCDSQKDAEISAAHCFLRDPQVVEVAARLPAPMKVIKYWEKLDRFRGTRNGHRIPVDSEDCRRRYNAQREQGCRMAVWDGVA